MAQSQPTRLITGQDAQLNGRLELKFRGYFSYLVLETGQTYRADGGSDEGTKLVRLVEVVCDGKFAQLAKHAGETVNVEGRLFVEFAAPVPYNGVRLEHAIVHLANGTVIRESSQMALSSAPKLPTGLRRYMLTSTMLPASAKDPPDELIDLDTGRKLPPDSPGYCSLSGAQDFITCACADGFSPVRGGLVKHPFTAQSWQLVPKPEDVWKEMRAAQFSVPERAIHPLHIQLVCQRDETSQK